MFESLSFFHSLKIQILETCLLYLGIFNQSFKSNMPQKGNVSLESWRFQFSSVRLSHVFWRTDPGGTFWCFLKVTSDYALLNGHRLEDWVWWMLKVLYIPRMFQIFLETCTRILESSLISCIKPEFAWHSLVIVIWPHISWLFTGSWNTLNKSKWQGTQMTDYWFATSRTPQFFDVWDPRYAC